MKRKIKEKAETEQSRGKERAVTDLPSPTPKGKDLRWRPPLQNTAVPQHTNPSCPHPPHLSEAFQLEHITPRLALVVRVAFPSLKNALNSYPKHNYFAYFQGNFPFPGMTVLCVELNNAYLEVCLMLLKMFILLKEKTRSIIEQGYFVYGALSVCGLLKEGLCLSTRDIGIPNTGFSNVMFKL